MEYTPGTKVRVVFDRATSFNGRTGTIVSIPAGMPPSVTTDVLVRMNDGSEAGRLVFFSKDELRPMRTLLMNEFIYMDALEEAADDLRGRENIAARAEGLGELCSGIVAIYSYHDGSRGEVRILFDYGQIGNRTGKSARVMYINDRRYELEWI